MLKNKLFTSFVLVCFICLLTKNAFAQDKDYTYMYSGECITENGFFFTENGMTKLVVNTEEKLKLITLDKQKEIDLIKIELGKCSALKLTELRIQKEMYENQLLIKQKAIDAYKSEIFWDNIKIVGGTVVGIGVGILVGVFLVK